MRNNFVWRREWVIAGFFIVMQVPAFAQSSVDKAWSTLQSRALEKGH